MAPRFHTKPFDKTGLAESLAIYLSTVGACLLARALPTSPTLTACYRTCLGIADCRMNLKISHRPYPILSYPSHDRSDTVDRYRVQQRHC